MFKFTQQYRIALVAPSGAIVPETVEQGKKVLEKYGHEVIVMPHVFAGNSLPHLAAPDTGRASDINAAIADDSIDLIWAVRGGAGALRILDQIDWEKLKGSGKYFAGFSDITAIHWSMAASGNDRYLAAPMMKFLVENTFDLTGETLHAALNEEYIPLKLPALRSGNICGTPLPGNLAVAASLCGTKFMPETSGKIIILEEVGEAPYRIDRMLTQLQLNGVFEHCAGIIFGNFTGCGSKSEVMAVLQDFTEKVTIPVFYGLPHGHELPFYSICGTQTISVCQ